MIQMNPKTKEAYELMHRGVLALAKMERNGICVDRNYYEAKAKDLEKDIRAIENKIITYPEVKEWKKRYGTKFNLDSPTQLRYILYDVMKVPVTKLTAKGGNSAVDKEVLNDLDIPMVKDIMELRKLSKTLSTYVLGILNNTSDDGLLHPCFNLHTVTTYRSSADSPNWQNIPTRDPVIKKLVRGGIIPREGHRFGGADYKAQEVRVGACYHKDPMMIEYIKNPKTDMHRDVAMDCFLLDQDQVSKDVRYCGKNMFVFPEFYGDYYKNCASNLWMAIDKMNLTTTEGVPMKEHLASKGIRSYNKFLKHIQGAEDRFWNEKFSVYRDWKDDWVRKYEKQGYVDMFTGFRCSGVMSRNDVINYPVQGAAFHCLLWSIIELSEWWEKQDFKSLLVGQIHDELTQDLHVDEFDYILEKEKQVMEKDIREAWPWIIVPLEVEFEFGEVNESWYKKKAIIG